MCCFWLFGAFGKHVRKALRVILGGVWDPFCIQQPAWSEKCIFFKMSVSYTRELKFGGSGVPETLPKASENRSQNVVYFFIEKTLKKGANMGAQRTPETYKKASQNHLGKTCKNWLFSKSEKGCNKKSRGLPLKEETSDERRPTERKPHKNQRNLPRTPSRPGAFGPERIFGCLLEGFCIHFGGQNASKMESEMENVCFWFWASRVGES